MEEWFEKWKVEDGWKVKTGAGETKKLNSVIFVEITQKKRKKTSKFLVADEIFWTNFISRHMDTKLKIYDLMSNLFSIFNDYKYCERL